MINKKIILSSGILLIIILSLNFISASGLCRGYDGYYHDCDDDRYFDNRYGYDNEYYYHGKYYPTRDYYYREYYRPKGSRYKYKRDNIEEYYKDVEEHKRTIEYKYEDRYGSEKIKYTINEKTEIEMDYEMPYYVYDYYPRRYYGDYEDYEDDVVVIKPIPWHYSQYQKYY